MAKKKQPNSQSTIPATPERVYGKMVPRSPQQQAQPQAKQQAVVSAVDKRQAKIDERYEQEKMDLGEQAAQQNLERRQTALDQSVARADRKTAVNQVLTERGRMRRGKTAMFAGAREAAQAIEGLDPSEARNLIKSGDLDWNLDPEQQKVDIQRRDEAELMQRQMAEKYGPGVQPGSIIQGGGSSRRGGGGQARIGQGGGAVPVTYIPGSGNVISGVGDLSQEEFFSNISPEDVSSIDAAMREDHLWASQLEQIDKAEAGLSDPRMGDVRESESENLRRRKDELIYQYAASGALSKSRHKALQEEPTGWQYAETPEEAIKQLAGAEGQEKMNAEIQELMQANDVSKEEAQRIWAENEVGRKEDEAIEKERLSQKYTDKGQGVAGVPIGGKDRDKPKGAYISDEAWKADRHHSEGYEVTLDSIPDEPDMASVEKDLVEKRTADISDRTSKLTGAFNATRDLADKITPDNINEMVTDGEGAHIPERLHRSVRNDFREYARQNLSPQDATKILRMMSYSEGNMNAYDDMIDQARGPEGTDRQITTRFADNYKDDLETYASALEGFSDKMTSDASTPSTEDVMSHREEMMEASYRPAAFLHEEGDYNALAQRSGRVSYTTTQANIVPPPGVADYHKRMGIDVGRIDVHFDQETGQIMPKIESETLGIAKGGEISGDAQAISKLQVIGMDVPVMWNGEPKIIARNRMVQIVNSSTDVNVQMNKAMDYIQEVYGSWKTYGGIDDGEAKDLARTYLDQLASE